MGKTEVNLQDQRYGFRAQMVLAMREYARRAMVAGVSKNWRTKEVDRKRSVVTIKPLGDNTSNNPARENRKT